MKFFGLILSKLAIVTVAFSLFFIVPEAMAQSYNFTKEINTGTFGSLTAPNDVAIGPDGKAAVADNDRVLVFDEYGNLLNEFGQESFFPTGVDLTSDGQSLWVSDFLGSIYNVSTIDWSFDKLGDAGSGPGEFLSPQSIATGSDGSVYVADTDNNRIQKFSPDGEFIDSWGNPGSGNGDFLSPQGVAAGLGGVLVADTDNSRVQIFDENGGFLLSAGQGGDVFVDLVEPAGVAIGPDGVYVSDVEQGYIQKLGFDGSYSQIGSGFLFSPRGLAVDKGGNVYVADTGNNRIAVFSPDIVVLNRGQSERNINIPAGVAVIIDIYPDSYWSNAPAELYIWLEVPSFGVRASYLGPDLFAVFNDLSQMSPLLSGFNVPPVRNLVPVLFSSTAGFPQVSFDFFVCLDRQLDGRFNPSASTCGSTTINLQ
jgi:DNA-binding beta-propeller fold protein YncE